MRIVQIVGARPQFIKLAPVSRELRRRQAAGVECTELIVHTGQHYDAAMSGAFFDELALPPPVLNLEVGSGPHGFQTARILEGLEKFLSATAPDCVVIYGDTNSTIAGALATVKLGIPGVHVEAGLRSFDRAMPEELNRVAADHLSDLLLAPTAAAVANLTREGLLERTHLVGDVMCDAVLWARARAQRASSVLARFGLRPGAYGVVTIHRAENTSAERLAGVVETLKAVGGATLPLVWPLHPRARVAMAATGIVTDDDSAVRMVDPQSYIDMLALVDNAAFVLTDSGGLQKEAFILGVPCITMRESTEWLESVAAGANVVVGTRRDRVLEAVNASAAARTRRAEFAGIALDAYGGGRAAERVVDVVLTAQRR